MTAADATAAPEPPTPRPGALGRLAQRVGLGVLAFVGVLLLLAAGLRAGVATAPGRDLVARLLEGQRLGPLGRLHVEGLKGDLLRRFTVRRLTVRDDRGVWLDTRDVALTWRPGELLSRRVHLERLALGDLVISRRPDVEQRPKGPPSEAPVSVKLDALQARIETRPAFSQVAGDWDVKGGVDYARSGRAKGEVAAVSRLHPGDGLTLDFRLGPDGALHLKGDAVEARGGALAGALGLDPARAFRVSARAEGEQAGGVFTLEAHSGDADPVIAHGRWTPEGGTLKADLAIGASRLTHYFAERIGPSLTIDATAHRRPDGLFRVDADLAGALAHAHLTGPVDVSRRRSPGMDLQLSVAALTPWAKPLVLGPTQARGALAFDAQGFAFKGKLTGQRLEQNGYVLQRLEGPGALSLAKGVWSFALDLASAGGAGGGAVLELLGPSPKIRLEGQFGDHRVLIRELHVTGSDVKVDGQGGQGLFGGYAFKGRALIPNLGVFHPGARGGLEGSWDAAQGKGEHPWRFTFDTSGRAFATGVAELDRLLGPSPRLTGQGDYVDGVTRFARLDLASDKAQASAKGALGRNSVLDFDVDWRAQGPFGAGPIEIAGQAHGGGRVEGTISEPRADLQADLAAIDFGKLVLTPAHLTLAFTKGPDGMDGRATLAGPTAQGPASARTAFRFLDHGVDLTDLAADAGGVKLAGALSLRDGQPSTADLTVSAGPGVFLSAGRLAGAIRVASRSQGAGVDLSLDGKGLAVDGFQGVLRTLSLRAQGPLDRLPFKISADSVAPVVWRFSGDGLLAKVGGDRSGERELTLNGAGKLRAADLRTNGPLRLRFGGVERSLLADVTIAGGTAHVEARQTVGSERTAGDLAAHAILKGVDLEPFNDDYRGALSADLTLNGRGGHLSGALDASLADARLRDAAPSLALSGRIHAALADTRMHLQADVSNARGLRAQVTSDLPTVASAEPFRIAIDRTQPLHGAFDAHGELAPLWDLFGGGERSLAGQLTAQGQIAGSLNAPDVTGQAVITKGAFKDASTGLNLANLDVQADFGRNVVQVRRFVGDDGRAGRLTGQGRIGLARDSASTFQLTLSKFSLLNNDLGAATASGAVNVTRDASGRAKLMGELVLDRADITTKTPTPTGVVPMDVTEINLPVRPDGDAPAVRPQGSGLVALDVNIRAARGVFVRGKGLDAEMSMDAHVGGTTLQPDLTGIARLVRGSFDFSGKRFDFDESGTVKLATKPENIRLDLRAERNDPALDATIRVRGAAAKPEITLSSVPVLPQDEILSRVLFGVSASQLSPFEAAQLASALAGLATGGGFDILSNLRQFAGLDRLALGGDASGGASISGGKYLTNNVYLELTGAAVGKSQTSTTTAAQLQRTGPSAEVDWRVRRNLSIVSQVWAGGDARLSVRFRKNY